MLVSYMQNSEVSMTKASYFEMCEMLGSEPVEEEIPVEYDDFPLIMQEAMNVYGYMQDRWEGMSGIYLGKDKNGILDIFYLLDIAKSDYQIVFRLITLIDAVRLKQINLKQETPAKE